MKYINIKTVFIATLIGIILAVVGCNNNKGRGNSTTSNMGVLPTINCLLSPNNSQGFCNYPYGNYPGFMNYDYTLSINGLTNNYATGFCGCGQSTTSFPVYNNNWGLGCVNNSSLPQQGGYNNQYNNVQFLRFTWNAQTRQWTSFQPYQQNNYYSNYYGAGASCSTYSVILACDTGAQGSCGPNGSCFPLSNNGGGGGYTQSGPGVCIMNQQNNYNSGYNNGGYNNGYNNGYNYGGYGNGYNNGYNYGNYGNGYY